MSPTPSGLLVATHELCWRHETGPGHPERPDRLTAAERGIAELHLDDAVRWVEAPPADRPTLERVHPAAVLDRLEAVCAGGGGAIDADTFVGPHSADAAWVAAGAGIDLIDRLDRGEASAGWSMVRPPGHHATTDRQMGFCLVNNVAVAAAALADRGERVVIVDIDAHHGNGTQDIFYDDGRVLFVSFHQSPLYPFSGSPAEIGAGAGDGATVNVAFPSGTTGDAYRRAIEAVVAPVVEDFEPAWLLVSAGFDGHRADPITDLGLTAGDFADIVTDLCAFAPPGRRLLFLEGGYDLRAMMASTAAVAAALVGERHRPERPTSGGPGEDAVERARSIHLDR